MKLSFLNCYRGTTLRRMFWKINLKYDWDICIYSYLFNFKFHLHEKSASYILWAGQTSPFFLSIFFFQHHITIEYVVLRIIKGNLNKKQCITHSYLNLSDFVKNILWLNIIIYQNCFIMHHSFCNFSMRLSISLIPFTFQIMEKKGTQKDDKTCKQFFLFSTV